MDIKATDKVIEIGSGNNPNPRSDILCDRYLSDNGQRAGGFAIVVDRPMVVADGYHLPFKDQAFDYAICSHILEHLKDPAAFLGEVSRVAKAGYIEVPSALSERIFGWDFHRWYCDKKGSRLILSKKTEGERFGGFFHRLIDRQIWFRRFFEENENEFYIRIEWKKSVDIELKDSYTADALENYDKAINKLFKNARPNSLKDVIFSASFLMRRIVRKIRKTLRIWTWRLKAIINRGEIIKGLMRILQCPTCRKTTLFYDKHNFIECRGCKSKYPVVGPIPILLRKEDIQAGY